jgi:hypothetical protein
MTLERRDNTLTGTYQYTKFGKDIRLKGTMLSAERFILNEFDSDGKQTGVFRGRFAGFIEPTDGLMGEWSSPNGERHLPFDLHRVTTPQKDIFTGTYKRIKDHEATITIRFLPDGTLYAKGEASWRGIMDNIHQGNIDGSCRIIEGDKAIYDENGICRLVIQCTKEGLVISEDKGECYGANVTFNGNYQRIPQSLGKSTGRDKKDK